MSLPLQSDLPSVSCVPSLRFQFDSPLVRLRGSFPRLRRASSPEVPLPTDKDPLPDLLAVSPSPEMGRFVVVLAVLLETLGQVVKMVLALFLFESRPCSSSLWRSHSRNWNGGSSSTSPLSLSSIPASVSTTSSSACWARDSYCSWTHVRAWALVITRATSVMPPPVVSGSRVCSSVSHSLSCGTSCPPTCLPAGVVRHPPSSDISFPPTPDLLWLLGTKFFRNLLWHRVCPILVSPLLPHIACAPVTFCTQSRATPLLLCHLAWPSWSTDSWKHSLLSHTPALPARVLLNNLVWCVPPYYIGSIVFPGVLWVVGWCWLHHLDLLSLGIGLQFDSALSQRVQVGR